MMDTSNLFLVGGNVSGREVVMMQPPRGPMTPDQARNLSAWLRVLADMDGTDLDGKKFEALVEAIKNT